MATFDLEVLMSLKDEASAKLKAISASAGTLGKTFGVVGGLMAGALGFAIKSASDAQVQMAKVDATLQAMAGTTRTVVVGTKEVSEGLKVTGLEAEQMRNAIESAKIAINKNEFAFKTLHEKLVQGKISQEEYTNAVEDLKNKNAGLTLRIQDYGRALTETSTKTIEITKTTSISAEAIKKAKEIILKAAQATAQLGFDNETAAVSLTTLFQRTGDVNEAIKLNNLAMDLSRAKNIDLATATNLVGQVLAGNGRVLKQYGIDIKDTASPLEALGELQSKVGGQATAFSKTLQGQIAILQVSFGNFAQEIGGIFIPIITRFINENIKPLIAKITEWKDAHPELFKQIVLTAGGLTLLLLGLSPVLIAISLISPAMIVLGLILAGLALGVFKLTQHWQEVKMAIEPFMEKLKEAGIIIGEFMKPAVDLLIISLKLLWDKLKFLWDLLSPILIPALKVLAFVLGATIIGAITAAIGAIALIALVITGFIEGIKGLGEKLGEIVFWFETAIPNALATLKNIWISTWEAIKTKTDEIIGFIMGKIQPAINAFNVAQTIVAAPTKAIAGAAKTVGAKIGGAIKSILKVPDAVITPQGQVIQTDPADFIFATKRPERLAGGINITITGNTFMSDERAAIKIGDMILNRLKLVSKISL